MPKVVNSTKINPISLSSHPGCITWSAAPITRLSVTSQLQLVGWQTTVRQGPCHTIPHTPASELVGGQIYRYRHIRQPQFTPALGFRQASSMTGSPIATIMPVSSRHRDEFAGATRPNEGYCQRTKASMPTS